MLKGGLVFEPRRVVNIILSKSIWGGIEYRRYNSGHYGNIGDRGTLKKNKVEILKMLCSSVGV